MTVAGGWRPGCKGPAGLGDHGCSLRNRSRVPAGLDIDDTCTDTDATRLLGLEGMGVMGVEDGEAGLVVHVTTTDEAARACPTCGTISTTRKERHRGPPWHS